MGYCVNSSGALIPFANDRAACSSVGGKFVEDINPTTRPADPKGIGFEALKTQEGTGAAFRNLMSPDAWIQESQSIADWGKEPGGMPHVGKWIDVLNPIPEIAQMIKNTSDPEVAAATWKFVKEKLEKS